MPTYTHLLLAVDFSKNTDEVIDKGLALAGAFEARVSLVHVVEFAQVDLSNELVMPQELELDQELLALAETRLQELVKRRGLDDKACFVRQGSTKREILNLAEHEGVDLIVIGSHGRSGIQLLLGSTANAVLHGAPCDVLAVRVKD
ncbi:MAG: universal stress protein [Thiogranum sp.]|jgi:universal stress protein A